MSSFYHLLSSSQLLQSAPPLPLGMWALSLYDGGNTLRKGGAAEPGTHEVGSRGAVSLHSVPAPTDNPRTASATQHEIAACCCMTQSHRMNQQSCPSTANPVNDNERHLSTWRVQRYRRESNDIDEDPTTLTTTQRHRRQPNNIAHKPDDNR